MPNPYRAEAEFVVAGERYALRFDWNAAVDFEQATGRLVSQALTSLAACQLSATDLRGLLWAGLRASGRKLSLEEAGDLIPRIGRAEAVRLTGAALRYYFPELGEEAAAAPPGEDADPPRPAPST